MMAPAALLMALLVASPAVRAQSGSSSHAVDQARLFIRKGWYEDARAELDEAAASPEGQASFDLHWLLSGVAFELLDVAAAVEHARIAAGLAQDADASAECWRLVEYYEGSFGALQVIAPQDGIASRLQLELTSTIFDPELKRFISRRTLALTERIPLPTEFWLPAGDYLVNGEPVTVNAGRQASLRLPLSAIGSRGLASLQVVRLELSGGFGVLFGSRVSNLHPGIDSQLALTVPVGRAFLGLTIDKSFRSYDVEEYGPSSSPEAFAGGLLVGTEVLAGGPLALRPGLGYRYGFLPGVAFDCVDSDAGISCTSQLPEEQVSTRYYGIGRVHLPYGQLSIDYRQGGRTNALGVGVRVVVDGVFGDLPIQSQGQRSAAGSEASVPVTISDGRFSAAGVRLLANLSIAL